MQQPQLFPSNPALNHQCNRHPSPPRSNLHSRVSAPPRETKMRRGVCHICLASLLKLLGFLQTFVGVSVIVYSLLVLDRWHGHRHPGVADGLGLDDHLPWFVWSLMGVGVVMCLIAFTGFVATEVANSCCLCFYALLATLFVILETFWVGYFVLAKQWEEDLPKDSTGELKRLHAFIEDNIDIFKWVGLSLVAIQALSILLAIILQAMISTWTMDYGSDDDFSGIRRPLLSSQYVPSPVLTSIDNKGIHSDSWSARIRQKYGLNPSQYNSVDPRLEKPFPA